MKKLVIATITLSYLIVFGLVGSEDLREEIDQAREYCEMTESGAWGAYDKTINCSEGENHE